MRRRVLIVDDSMLMRRLMKETLVADGWDVVGEAADGREATEKYQQLWPDAVTLDIIMPETDGIQALQAILAINPHAKVVVVSALNQTKLISEAIRAGAEDFIAKPFMPEQLQDTLRTCVEAPAARVIRGGKSYPHWRHDPLLPPPAVSDTVQWAFWGTDCA